MTRPATYSDTLGPLCQYVYENDFAGRKAGHVCNLSAKNFTHDAERKRTYNRVHDFVEPPLQPIIEYLREELASAQREIGELRDKIDARDEVPA